MQFVGAFTALVTPFYKGAVDEERYRAFIEWQIEEGINGLVPCGTTGESATLSHEEHEKVIEICIDQAKGRVPVLAGAGSNNTQEAIRLTRFAKEAGASGALLITPYYNKPTQEGLYLHYKAIHDAVDFPMVLYNVPGRTGCNLLPTTVGRLAKDFKNYVGIKEATGNLAQVSDVIQESPSSFNVLSGDDFTVLPLMSLGGCGVISVTSNIMPAKMAALCAAFKAGDVQKARQIHYELMPLNKAMFVETNPTPAKTALAMMGKMDAEIRLPLCNLSHQNCDYLRGVLESVGIKLS